MTENSGRKGEELVAIRKTVLGKKWERGRLSKGPRVIIRGGSLRGVSLFE